MAGELNELLSISAFSKVVAGYADKDIFCCLRDFYNQWYRPHLQDSYKFLSLTSLTLLAE